MSKSLRVLNVNAQSLSNKVDKLEYLLLTYDPHITIITETWLHEGINDSVLIPPRYQIFRRDWPTRGGGVAIVLKDCISARPLQQIHEHESLFLKVSCWGHYFTVCAIYRPPSSTHEYLSRLYDHMCTFKNDRLILAGDFNLPNVDWRVPCSGSDVTMLNPLADIALMCDLVQIVNECTREAGNTRSTLDLVFLNSDVCKYTVSIEDGISDHKAVFLSFSISENKAHRQETEHVIKDYSKADDQAILDYLWFLCDNLSDDVSIAWNEIKTAIHYCTDKFVPSKRVRKNRNNPWITRDIIHLHRKLKRARKKKKIPCRLISLKAQLATRLSEAKARYFNHSLPNFLKTNPDRFWRYLSDAHKTPTEISVNGCIVNDPVKIANQFNQYFHSVFTQGDHADTNIFSLCTTSADFITVEGVLSLLLNVKTKSSDGPDGIPNAFLQRYAEPIAHVFTHIFRLSLHNSILPDDWRTARVIPVFKKGDRLNVENYRPISITSGPCKLLEHIITHYIMSFLEENSILTPFQHGFRKGLSTTTQLVTTIHDFAMAIDKGDQIDAIFLDFRKAFDCVCHSKLLTKLSNIGLPITVINWIRSYLTSRKQFVQVEGCCSGVLPVTSGVPQGSVLGPVLFLIFINDIVSSVDTSAISLKLFADDCILYKPIKSERDQECLQNNLNSLSDWCHTWSMELNISKSVYMRISNKITPFASRYTLNNNPLIEVSNFKYLGVNITNRLSWSNHIDDACSSASRKLGFLRHKLKNAPTQIKLLAYNTFIRPRLEYACVAWDPYFKKDVYKLEMVQRRAVRFIYNAYHNLDSPSSLMATNNIPLLKQRRTIARLKFLFLLRNHQFNIDPSKYISPSSSRKTRHAHNHDLTPYFARTNLFKHSFFPRTISEWNALPSNVFPERGIPDFENYMHLLCNQHC